MALISGQSRAQIISQSFSLIGRERSINDITKSPSVESMEALYETLKLDLLSKRPWRFATTSAQLTQLTNKPVNETYAFAYSLPKDYLTLNRIYMKGVKGGSTDFQLYEDQIFTNLNNDVFIDYRFNVKEENFPAYIVLYLVYKLAFMIAMPNTQNLTLAEAWDKVAKEQLIMAMNQDYQSFPTPIIQRNPILAAHYGLGGTGQGRVG